MQCRNFLRDHDGDSSLATRRDSVHVYVREQFSMGQEASRRSIMRRLRRLAEARIEAGYSDTFPHTPHQVVFLIVQAETVLKELDSLT